MKTAREIKKTEDKIEQLQQKLTDLYIKQELEEKAEYEGKYAILHNGNTEKFVIGLIKEFQKDDFYPFVTEYDNFKHAVLIDENISFKELVEKLKSL